MNVKELRDHLKGIPGKTEVRLAIQPSYPFQHHLADVVLVDLSKDEEEPDVEGEVVYLLDGEQFFDAPYLPNYVAETIGWQ